jgi:glycosyltransferase involved in cell wall biosynthesis
MVNKVNICHITTVHSSNDIRIYKKECLTLADHFKVILVAAKVHDEDEVNSSVEIKKINIRRSRIKRIFFSFFDTLDALKKVDAVIYHLHDPELLPLGYFLKLKGKTVIYDAHEDLPRAILSKYWIPRIIRKPISIITEIIENFIAKKLDLIIAATPYIGNRFKKINNNTIVVNNYPFIGEFSNESNDYNFKDKEKIVSYVGGITLIRGALQLMAASNYLNEGKIVLAGPLDNKELIEKIRDLDNIRYLGILNRKEVKSLFNQSIAGIVTFLPEPNHINAQPNKMFEYMSAGLPVICSNFPLWKEIIEKHDCGICVDPKDPKAIADAINYLIDHPEAAERMGRNGRKAVETEYNWETESKKLIKAYNDLLKHKK